ncbi:helicase-associated domain-containing protein [Streptomyces sp. TP-A0874]|uniref:helicase-associated domain-containing protein n=1 Tax=Streptomyces sp. TP-A0874 TaxID=549819 RepID=UPI0008533CD2|nr:helicase-associated domain-containing protein [Streptomyces sp. TP-A0874]
MESPTDRAGHSDRQPRTLSEELRGRSEEQLAALLRARPDLLSPLPSDLTQLATRAATRASVTRALGRLDRFVLQTAEALAVAADPCDYDTLLMLMAGDDRGQSAPDTARELPRAVAALRGMALLWGGEDRLHLVRTARELLAPGSSKPSPTGLGPTVAEATAGMSPGRLQEIISTAGLGTTPDPVTAVAELTSLFNDRRRLAALLDGAPADSRSVLDRLTWGPPYGTVPADPAAPIRWLLARGLLLPTGPGSVVLPREAALHLRGGRAHRRPEPVPPALETAAEYPVRVVDATAAGQAFAAVSMVEELLRQWDTGGPSVLRAGGLSIRDLRRTATALEVDEPTAAFWLEVCYASGLLAADGESDERFAATPACDDWLRLPPQERWAALVSAWLPATRTAGVVGDVDSKARPLAALGPGLDRSPAPEVRRRTLALLASLPPGSVPSPESVHARLRWEHGDPADPQRSAEEPTAASGLRARIAAWTLLEAELLGLTGRGALAGHGRTLLAPSAVHPPEAAEAAQAAAAELAPLLPEPLDHILLQADLTAVAPGPLQRPLAEMLSVLAEVESTGGATVYRFTPASVRRALDAGRTTADIHAFLADHSRTPVPQPLSYLVDDVARRYGRLRVGAASAYVRCDDEGQLAEILADRRSAELRLRRLAPTVLAAEVDPGSLLEGLREMGYAPAAESAGGDLLVSRADSRRTGPRTPPEPVPGGPPAPGGTLVSAAVRAIRAGDRASTAVRKPVSGDGGGDGLPRTSPAETLATVQAAALTGSHLWIGYVNAEGAASQRVIAPVRVEGGFVTAYDHTAGEVRTFPLHRVTGAAELADDPA